MTGPDAKQTPSVEESIANMTAQIEKLADAFAGVMVGQLWCSHKRLKIAD
jgi:hypothetical protein